MPIEIGLQGRSAPGVGLRRRKRRLPGRRRLSRRLKSAFPGTYAPGVGLRRRKRRLPGRRRLSRRLEIGLLRRLRARRRPPPTQKTPPRSAQADRWPKAPGGRIHSAHRPTVGRRPSRRLKSASQGAARQASASADAKDTSPVGAGRPLAEGPWRPNSFGPQADRRPQAPQVQFIRHPPRHASASNRASPTLRLIPGPANPKRQKAPPYPIARRACATSASSGASPASAQARR
jgi:hypothetical protein